MTFFSRPNLENEQFKQLSNSVLTLSGQTQIVTTTGFTLSDGSGGNVIVTASGGTNYDVLTLQNGIIKLLPSAASGGSMYVGASPASISLGGISGGTVLTGKTISTILQELLVPTQHPALIAPSNTFTIVPATTLFEVGATVVFTGSSTFNRGCITPQYTSASDKRSGLPSSYRYTDMGSNITDVPSVSLSNTFTMASRVITSGNNVACGNVAYSCGEQPKNSDGTNYCAKLPSGRTSTITKTVTGVYPYFWGSTVSAPILTSNACAQCLITGGTKCVGYTGTDVSVTNYNVTGKYIWLAIPAASTTKTKWQGANSPSNCGTIPGDLFAAECQRNITSPTGLWGIPSVPVSPTPVPYKIYVSNYPTSISYEMIFKNS